MRKRSRPIVLETRHISKYTLYELSMLIESELRKKQ